MTQYEAHKIVLQELYLYFSSCVTIWDAVNNTIHACEAFEKEWYAFQDKTLQTADTTAPYAFLDLYLHPYEVNYKDFSPEPKYKSFFDYWKPDIDEAYLDFVAAWVCNFSSMRPEVTQAAVFEQIDKDRSSWLKIIELIGDIGYAFIRPWLQRIQDRSQQTGQSFSPEEIAALETAERELSRIEQVRYYKEKPA